MRPFIMIYLVICLCNLLFTKYLLVQLAKDKKCVDVLMEGFGIDILSVSSLGFRDYCRMLIPIVNILTFLSVVYCIFDFEGFKKSIIEQGENK